MDILDKPLYSGVALALCLAVLPACSDDNDAPAPEPEPVPEMEISAAADTGYTLYSPEGTFRIPLTVSNATEELKPEAFTITPTEEGAFNVVAAENTGENCIVTVSYSMTATSPATTSFTLGYRDTDTAIPVSITCYNAFSLTSSFIAAGTPGRLTVVQNDGAGQLPDVEISEVKFSGPHAGSFTAGEVSGLQYSFEVNDTFSLSEAETDEGYAAVPVAVTMQSGGNTFTVSGTVEVCAGTVLPAETVTADETRHIWMLPTQLDAFGMDKTGNMVSLIGRKAEYYFARKGEPLLPVKESGFEVTGAAGERHHWVDETQEEFIYPAIYLMKANTLPPGEYLFVAHLKKLRDTADNRWVDIVMPVTK